MSEREFLTPPGDRVEYWSWEGQDAPTQYIEMVYVQNETVRVSYNVFAMLMRESGYRQVQEPWKEKDDSDN